MILGLFGASCLLMFAYPASPFAQPRNVIGGHVIATFTGLAFMALFGIHWWSLATAVGTAIALMLLFRMPHPPACSNPLIVMLGAVKWRFLITPTLLGDNLTLRQHKKFSQPGFLCCPWFICRVFY